MSKLHLKSENKIQNKTHFIFLSPHLDDAVWSCGGFISIVAKAGCKTDVITVHTGNPTESDLPKLQQKEITAKGSLELRKNEDTEALKVLNVLPTWWDLPTRLLRQPWLTNRLHVFKTPAGDEIMKDENYHKITEKLHQLIETYPEAKLICPMGVGHMYDHVELFTACIQVGHEKDHLKNMMFYEDSYAILTQNRTAHFLLKDHVWKKKDAPQNTSIWWRTMGRVMSKSASGVDIRSCIPKSLLNSNWKIEQVNIKQEFDLKMESLSKYDSQMRQFGGMKRVRKAFKKYHAYWNHCEPYWYIKEK